MESMKHLFSGVDVSKLAMAIKRQPELWNKHKQRLELYENTGPHNGLSDIWVRYNDFDNFKGDMAEFNSEHDSVWYPAYDMLPQVRDIVFPLMNAVEGERLGGVLITKIPPGKTCKPHVDGGWHAEYYDKYAVQIESSEGQAFHFHGESFVSMPGDVYWFDNSKTHWVTNESNQDRVTMIVCIKSRGA